MPRNAEQDLALLVGKPLGYYLSARESHPAYPILKKLETQFGSHFERLSTSMLRLLLIQCACHSDLEAHGKKPYPESSQLSSAHALLKQLQEIDPSWVLGLVPFLSAQITAREGAKS